MSDFDLNPDLYSLEYEPDDSYFGREIDSILFELDTLLAKQGLEFRPNFCRHLAWRVEEQGEGIIKELTRLSNKHFPELETFFVALAGAVYCAASAELYIRSDSVPAGLRIREAWTLAGRARELLGIARVGLHADRQFVLIDEMKPGFFESLTMKKGRKQGGIEGAKTKKEEAKASPEKVEEETRKLLDAGWAFKDTASKVAEKLGVSATHVRRQRKKTNQA